MKYPNLLSNCCGAEILQANKDEHGRCADCMENCIPEEPEDMIGFEGTSEALKKLTIISNQTQVNG